MLDDELLPPTLEPLPGAPTPVRAAVLETVELACGAGAPGAALLVRARFLVERAGARVAPIGQEPRAAGGGGGAAGGGAAWSAAARCFSCGQVGHLQRACPLTRSRARGPGQVSEILPIQAMIVYRGHD